MAGNRYTPSYSPGQVPRGAYAAALSNPFDQIIGQVENAAQAMVNTGAAQNAEAKVFGGEQPSMLPGFTQAQRTFNGAAQAAYQARTEADVRAKTAELSAKYTGIHPEDAQHWGTEFDAFAGAVTGAVPDEMRPRIASEFAARRAFGVAQITANANRFELQRSDSAIQAGIAADVQEAGMLARDGADPEALGALYTRAESRIDERVALGLLSAQEAAIQKTEARSGVQSEAVFGEALRSGNGVSVIQQLMAGKGPAEGLTLKDRDTLVAKITGEMNRQHGEMVRAESEDRLANKAEREVIKAEFWKGIYSGDAGVRPTTDDVMRGVRAGAFDGDEAQSMFNSLATDRAARNDTAAIADLESLMASGADIGANIADEQAAGRIAPEVAADLREKNAANQRRDMPEPIIESRRQVNEIYTLTGPFAGSYPAEEQARKVSALQFFDETVRAADPGIDPETGLTFREIAAQKAFAVLELKERERVRARAFKTRRVLPRSAAIAETPSGQALNLGQTVSKLRLDHMVGLLGRDEMLAEFRLIDQWERAGLTVRK